MVDSEYEYDLAVSFAGVQRPYVDEFVRECKRRGLRVFYDRDMTVAYWGKNFIYEFRKVYGSVKPRYVVPFISTDYVAKPYPMDELATAIEQGFQRTTTYILPVVVGDVDVPRELLNPAVGFLRADDHSAAELADRMVEKLEWSRRTVAPSLRTPRIPPTSFDDRSVLVLAVETIGSRFESAPIVLKQYGYSGHVTRDAGGVDVAIRKGSQPVCGLSVWDDTSSYHGRSRLNVNFGWPGSSRQSWNGWIAGVWDAQAGAAALEFTDFASGSTTPTRLSVDQLVDVLWEKILGLIEDHAV